MVKLDVAFKLIDLKADFWLGLSLPSMGFITGIYALASYATDRIPEIGPEAFKHINAHFSIAIPQPNFCGRHALTMAMKSCL